MQRTKHEELREQLRTDKENFLKARGAIQPCQIPRDSGVSRGKVNAGSLEELAEMRDEVSQFSGEDLWEM